MLCISDFLSAPGHALRRWRFICILKKSKLNATLNAIVQRATNAKMFNKGNVWKVFSGKFRKKYLKTMKNVSVFLKLLSTTENYFYLKKGVNKIQKTKQHILRSLNKVKGNLK